jgi:putative addiction module antidote
MLTKKITAVGNSAAVLLSKDLLAILDVKVGDEVEVKVVDDALVLRSIKQQERSEQFNLSAKRVLEKRRSALARLA